MEKLGNDLFQDPNLEAKENRAAGAVTICATAIGGTTTHCISNPGGPFSDIFLDTGP